MGDRGREAGADEVGEVGGGIGHLSIQDGQMSWAGGAQVGGGGGQLASSPVVRQPRQAAPSAGRHLPSSSSAGGSGRASLGNLQLMRQMQQLEVLEELMREQQEAVEGLTREQEHLQARLRGMLEGLLPAADEAAASVVGPAAPVPGGGSSGTAPPATARRSLTALTAFLPRPLDSQGGGSDAVSVGGCSAGVAAGGAAPNAAAATSEAAAQPSVGSVRAVASLWRAYVQELSLHLFSVEVHGTEHDSYPRLLALMRRSMQQLHHDHVGVLPACLGLSVETGRVEAPAPGYWASVLRQAQISSQQLADMSAAVQRFEARVADVLAERRALLTSLLGALDQQQQVPSTGQTSASAAAQETGTPMLDPSAGNAVTAFLAPHAASSAAAATTAAAVTHPPGAHAAPLMDPAAASAMAERIRATIKVERSEFGALCDHISSKILTQVQIGKVHVCSYPLIPDCNALMRCMLNLDLTGPAQQ